MEFKKTQFSKNRPTTNEIELGRVTEKNKELIEDEFYNVVLNVAQAEYGECLEHHTLEELLGLLDEKHIQVFPDVVLLDGKYYVTFMVNVFYRAVELDV